MKTKDKETKGLGLEEGEVLIAIIYNRNTGEISMQMEGERINGVEALGALDLTKDLIINGYGESEESEPNAGMGQDLHNYFSGKGGQA